MWKKLLITGCMAFCLLGGSALSAQPSCETKEEVTSEQLNRTKMQNPLLKKWNIV